MLGMQLRGWWWAGSHSSERISALAQWRYARPDLLLIDEIGYLSYSNRHADLLFELISRRYQKKSTVVTTNKSFGRWPEVFPNASCVVSLIDRLVHRCEVVAIEGESYRLKEAKERTAQKAAARASTGRKAIRHMLDQLVIDSAGFTAQYRDSTGRTLPMFNLTKDLATTLVSGYSIPMPTARASSILLAPQPCLPALSAIQHGAPRTGIRLRWCRPAAG
jgi:hypothetical protein